MLQSVVNFLRAGYPEGVPERDYQPLLALLRRRLTEDELREVVDGLSASGDKASAAAICRAIEGVIQGQATEQDIARVRAHLAAGGWPLADLDGTG
jgi:hypothetical protein